jgi:hypothetical protein
MPQHRADKTQHPQKRSVTPSTKVPRKLITTHFAVFFPSRRRIHLVTGLQRLAVSRLILWLDEIWIVRYNIPGSLHLVTQ